MADNLESSPILVLSKAVNEKIAAGENVFNLTVGDFNPKIFPIPTALTEEIISAYNAGLTNYPPTGGLPELKQAISRYVKRKGNMEYSTSEVTVTGGARPLIYGVYQTLLDPGDTVLFPVPSWNNHYYSHLAHCKQQMIETTAENNFMITADDLRPHIQSANLLALCSPQNPSGTCFTKEQLEDICDLVLEENNRRGPNEKPVYVLYDQIYWILTHGDVEHVNPVLLRPEIKDYTINIDGISKAFAATGVRIGWATGPEKIISKLGVVITHMGAWAPKPEQSACAKYLDREDEVDEYLTEMKKKISDRLNAFYNGFKALRQEGFKVDAISPQAAMYLTIQLDLVGLTPQGSSKLTNPKEVNEFILSKAGMALVPFYGFGASDDSSWFRLSVGTTSMKMIDQCLAKLKVALDELS
ncbi:MAG: aminotransferase class I/II-fold pyridoxal phosphate-dependent enzyme [Flavobacteriales bacterium]|nr:aminotransferase class I/II-fold pyridoxal phosphate-dependent enzyme [Flavobacteriales bacterium]